MYQSSFKSDWVYCFLNTTNIGFSLFWYIFPTAFFNNYRMFMYSKKVYYMYVRHQAETKVSETVGNVHGTSNF